jgi:glycosyltransferase involved in cell wall biosynthesis
LGLRHEVTYLYFTNEDPQPGTTELPFCRRIVSIPKPLAYGPADLAKGLLTRWPLPILNYQSAAMQAAIQRLTREQTYDAVHFDSIHMIRYRELLSPALRGRILYNWHNIESEAMRRFSETVRSPLRSLYARLTAKKIAALENDILHSGFGHVVCSERELHQLHSLRPEARVQVVDNGVDVESFAAVRQAPPPDSAAPLKLVFVGSMDYFPNTEAALSFTQNIWPTLHGALPAGAQLFLVGAAPPPSVVALGQIEGVTVTGTVPDIKPFYEGATAALVPLRTGGGTRLKILEAMAAGVPVISTPLGAEGLAVTAQRDILLASPDDPAQWVRHVTALAQSAEQRRSLSHAGLELVRTRYDWEILGATLARTYEEWLSPA